MAAANKARVAAAVIALAVGGIGAFLDKDEGNETESYEDVVGVYTICGGVTHNVKPGMKLTDEQCKELNREVRTEFVLQVASMIEANITPDLLIAHSRFAYNIGINGYKNQSATLRLTNQGRFAEGCRAMLNWYRGGGRDCRVRSNNCYGLWMRRQREVAQCLAGVKGSTL